MVVVIVVIDAVGVAASFYDMAFRCRCGWLERSVCWPRTYVDLVTYLMPV